MQNSSRTILAGVTASFMLLLAGCAGDTDEAGATCTPAYEGFETLSEGTLTVATYDIPPHVIVEDDDISGMEGDLITEVADRLCLELSVVSAGGASAAIPSVETGRADISAGSWYRTADREEIVRLSAPLYLDNSSIVSMSGLTVDDLADAQVGSTVGNLWNNSVQDWIGNNFSIYQDEEGVYGDLRAGRIDAAISSTANALARLENNPIDGVTLETVTPHENIPEFDKPGQITWPTSYDNEEFSNVVDQVIADMHEDGTITSIVTTWGLDESAAEPLSLIHI